MANSDKNIRIVTSKNKATYPNIVFTGSAAGSSVITLNVLDDNTLSFESDEGQVFSLNSNLSSGTIFSVTDISGIHLIRASAGATIGIAEYSGLVGIGTDRPIHKLHVRGQVAFASTNDQSLTFIFDNSLPSGNANLQIRSANEIRFYNSANSFYTGLKSGSSIATTVFTLPISDGSAGQILRTNGFAGLSFTSFSPVSSLSSVVSTQAQNTNHLILFTPSQNISGSAVSSNPVLVYNPFTQLLSVSGLAVTSNTDSTSTTSGSLIVTGGVGIGQSISISGRLQLFNGSFFTGFRSSQSGVNTTYILPNTTPSAIGTSVLSSTQDGVLSWVPMTVTAGGAGTVNNGNVYSLAYYETAGSAVTGISNVKYYPGIGLSISDTTANTGSTYDGALQVSGGVGIGGSLFVTNAIVLGYGVNGLSLQKLEGGSFGAIYSRGVTPSSTNYSLATNGTDLNLNSTNNVYLNISNTAKVTVSTNNVSVGINVDSTSTTTGAFTVTKGVGFGGNAFIGGTVTAPLFTGNFSGTAATITNIYGTSVSSPTITSSDKINIQTSTGQTAAIQILAGNSGASGTFVAFDTLNKRIGIGISTPVYTIDVVGDINASAGQSYRIGGSLVLNSTTLGSNVVNSSLTSLGTITTGVWSGTAITTHYGGTGLQTPLVIGDLLYADTTTTWARLAASTSGSVLASQGPNVAPQYVAQSTLNVGSATTATNINTTSTTSNLRDHYLLFSPTNGGSGVAVSSGTGLSFNPNTTLLGVQKLSVFDTTNSTSLSSGALIVSGGVGVGGTVSAGGRVTVGSNSSSSSTETGALVVAGGMGLSGNAFIGGTVNISNTTNSTSTSSGALVISGGLGVSGDVYVSSNTGSKLSIMQSSGDEGGEIFLNKPVTNTTLTTGVTVDIFQNKLRFFEAGGSNRGFYLDISSGGNAVGTNIMGGSSSGTVNNGTATFAAYYASNTNAVNENANLQFTGTGISIGGNIQATSTTSGSLFVRGGVGIGNTLFVGGTIRLGSDTFTKSYSLGDIALDNGSSTDTPGITYYWGNNSNFGNDVLSDGVGSTRYRIVYNLNETGGREVWTVDQTGQMRLYNSGGSAYIGFRYSGSAITSYTLPNNSPQSSAGTSVLSSTIDGVMSWVPMTSGSSSNPGDGDTAIQFNDSGSFGGTTAFTFNKVSNLVSIASTADHRDNYNVGFRLVNDGPVSNQFGLVAARNSPGLELVGIGQTGSVTSGGNYNRFAFDVIGASNSIESSLRLRYSWDGRINGAVNFLNLVQYNSTKGLGIGASDSSYFNYFRTPNSQASDKIYILPNDFPSTGTSYLASDTSGNLSWSPVVSSTGSTVSSGVATRLAYYQNSGTAITDTFGINYRNSGTASTFIIFGGASSGNTIFSVHAESSTSLKVGIGVSLPTTTLDVSGDITASNVNIRKGNSLLLYSSGDSNYTEIKSNSASNYTLTFPTSILSSPAIGSTYYIVSNSTGALSFAPIPKQTHRIQFATSYNPTVGGDSAVFMLPFSYSDGISIVTWRMRRVDCRVETSSATGSTFSIEKYAYNNGSGIGTFSTTSTGSTENIMSEPLRIIGSGIAETYWTTFAGTHITAMSGDKLRLNFSNVSALHENFSISLIMEQDI